MEGEKGKPDPLKHYNKQQIDQLNDLIRYFIRNFPTSKHDFPFRFYLIGPNQTWASSYFKLLLSVAD